MLQRLSRPVRVHAHRFFSSTAAASSSAAAAASSGSAGVAALPAISVLRLDHLRLPIRSQLRIEEALLRSKDARVAGRSFFLLNQPPAAERCVVMGLSNKTELLVHLDAAERDNVQIVRRFSGGGTVFVDQQCWMASLLVQKHPDAAASPAAAGSASASATPLPPLPHGLVHPASLPAYPDQLMKWTKDFYAPVFGTADDAIQRPEAEQPLSATTAAVGETVNDAVNPVVAPPFSLTGHDYCFASRKFGGNAQTITRDRWLHHTSFLWTLDSLGSIEEYLRLPGKQPAYRANRTHGQFLTSLREVWEQAEAIRAKRRREALSNGAAGSLIAEPSVEELDALESRTNAPSAAELYSAAGGSGRLVLPWDNDVEIPPRLAARVLWRLGHFFRLEYPTLEEVAEVVERYESEEAPGRSGVKLLDIAEERAREERDRRAAEAKEEAKIAAAMAVAAAST